MTDNSRFDFWMNWGVQLAVGMGTLLLAAAAVYADAFKAWRVRLSIVIDKPLGLDQPVVKGIFVDGVQQTVSPTIPARFYQLRILNRSRWFFAHQTFAWLTALERVPIDHRQDPYQWRGELPLLWQHTDFLPGSRAIGRRSALADLFAISAEGILSLQLRNAPVGMPTAFTGACELWATVQARSDESSSGEYRVHIRWDGKWEADPKQLTLEFSCKLLDT